MDNFNKGVEAVSDFFQGNPYGSPVGQRIEKATDTSLASENWALNLEICDLINDTEDGPRDAVRAIRKRLQTNMGKNHTVVMYTLTVLETCAKNCSRRFHVLITQKDFVQELTKMISTKYDPPQILQDKVLSLIQCWADAFKNIPECSGVVEIYNELRAKQVDFPMTDLDNMAPLITPPRSVAPQPQQPSSVQHRSPHGHGAVPAAGQHPAAHHAPMMPISPNPEQLAKLRSELDIVQGNLTVLREMLSELHPGQEDPDDFQLLQDLHKTCVAMQRRIVRLLETVASEEVTSELLLLNDELNNVFIKYDRYIKNRQGQGRPAAANEPPPSHLTQQPTPPSTGAGAHVTQSNDNLIDFGASPHGSAGAAKAGAQPATGGDDFDMFAQSRNVSYQQSKQSGSTYADNTAEQLSGLSIANQQRANFVGGGEPAVPVSDRESDLKEMQGWLGQGQGGQSYKPLQSHGSTGVSNAPVAAGGATSQEFDQFLAQRASVGEHLPSAGQDSRQLRSREEEEQKMFAL